MSFSETDGATSSASATTEAAKNFVEIVIAPHVEKLTAEIAGFDSSAKEAVEEADQAYSAEDEKKQKEHKREKISFQNAVERWKRKLGKKFSRLGEIVAVIKGECLSEVKQRLRVASEQKQLETLNKALLNPCGNPVCKQVCEMKAKLERELADMAEECKAVKEEADKAQTKCRGSAHIYEECKVENKKLEDRVALLSDKLAQSQRILDGYAEKEDKAKKLYELQLAQMSLDHTTERQDYLTRLKGHENAIKSLQEENHKLRTDYEALLHKDPSAKPVVTLSLSQTETLTEETKLVAVATCRMMKSCMQNLKELMQCPITRNVMEDPTVCSDGHTYERKAIEEWRVTKGLSPISREPLSETMFKNYLVKRISDALQTSMKEAGMG